MSFGLGRGLEALIPNKKPVRPQPVAKESKGDNPGYLEVPLEKIVPNPLQPRKKFKVDKLQELSDSIKEYGLIEPLMVSPATAQGSYVLIAGERRLRAAELAGLNMIPVTIRETDDQQKLELALVENIQRQDLNPLEEARAIKKLMSQFNLSQNEAAKKVGRSRPAVANCLRLLELAAEAQKALLDDKISSGHAKALLGVSNQTKQVEVLRSVVDTNMSVRDTERLVKKILVPTKRTTMQAETLAGVDQESLTLARELSSKLGAKVNIVEAPNGGRIVVEYYSKDERDRIAEVIKGNAKATNKTGKPAQFTV